MIPSRPGHIVSTEVDMVVAIVALLEELAGSALPMGGLPPGRVFDSPRMTSLANNFSYWIIITKDVFVLESIKGYRIQFQSVPPLTYPSDHKDAIPHSLAAIESLDQEIDDLLKKNAIEPVLPHTKGFFSRLFLVARKGGGGGDVLF